ncbi:M42 family metallopeptidase [Sulfoacidibacillus thermotolerans]|uniref:Peptidase M42 n=1 Tax=Sulfoacidibacillus thermotolerans TaxID=1765684 RepID=A0A2U3D6Z3_SULT2|nr:M42 family metallopeptidase [Sulfoacidibacillus thermotolerans]PWI57052.1 peptidase M42 [Sulfoacidibacillus thermotolerans]
MLLRKLTEAFGPSGFEDEIRQVIYEEVKSYGDKIYTDALGSLIVETNMTARGPKILLAAHMDEVGFMIVDIEDHGLLRFRPLGGVDPRILVSKPVLVGKDRIFGVIGSKAVHLQEPKEREQPLELQQLYIDIGAHSREEAEKYIAPGDLAVFATKYEEIGERRAKAKSFDDRVGCAVLIETMRKKFDLPIVYAFTVQEETGLRGAGPVAYRIKPNLALVVEGTVCFDVVETPSHGQSTLQGAGPAISVVDAKTIAHRAFREHIVQVGTKEGIPVQLRRTIGGANDVGAIHLTEMGIISAAISIPTRYIHAPSQMISLDDYDNTVRLLEAVLRSIEQGGFSA